MTTATHTPTNPLDANAPARAVDVVDFVDLDAGKVKQILGFLVIAARVLHHADESRGFAYEDHGIAWKGLAEIPDQMHVRIASIQEAVDGVDLGGGGR